MVDPSGLVSNAFQTFMHEEPELARASGTMVGGVGAANRLDQKTAAVAYLAVLPAQRLESGVPFYVQVATQAGASRDETISAIPIGLPAAGLGVTQVLPGDCGLRCTRADTEMIQNMRRSVRWETFDEHRVPHYRSEAHALRFRDSAASRITSGILRNECGRRAAF